MNYSVNDLKIFLLAADSGSLSAAARRAQITPAGVSAIVKRLEAETGARLLERSSRACRLTLAGERFSEAATQALQLLQDSENAIRHANSEPRGTVRIAAPSDLSRTLLSVWLTEFQTLHPKVDLVVSLSDTVQDLLRNSIDLAIRYGELPDSSLVARKLCMTRRVTAAAPGYWDRHGRPKTPQDLSAHNCMCFNVGDRLDTHWQFAGPDGRVQRVTVKGHRHSDDSALVKQWAVEGLGVVNKSDIDMVSELRSGALEAVLTEWSGPAVPLSLVHSGRRSMTAATRAVAEFIVAACKAQGAQEALEV